jgi:predicted nucleotidyltransferase
LLNISGKIDQGTIELLRVVDQVANETGTTYLIVGATARDMVMHYGYGAADQRATADLDFAVQLPDWEAYTNITERLVEHGFQKGRSPQRLISPPGIPIDLVPFGEIADGNLRIQWPPSGETVMDVTGFDEAHACAMQVTVQEDPLLNVPIASPPGLMLLKLIAWNDRAQDLRQKDATDIAYLLETYQSVEGVLEQTYGVVGLLDAYGWDIDIGTANMLGQNTAAIANSQTRNQIIKILDKNFAENTPNHLAEEMCSRNGEKYADRLSKLEAFSNGFRA